MRLKVRVSCCSNRAQAAQRRPAPALALKPAWGLALAAACAGASAADPATEAPQLFPLRVATAELADLSLEQLREVVVFTVSRQEERLSQAAASIYVITAEDIRRSGATTLPEALRLAPMLDVARADANQYAISARGFNNVLANKMLVLIDGRTVYSPLFSGVFWEAQDVVLGDVDRIEVISGPSTALWGTNAVNGMINVITRKAGETLGTSLDVAVGDRDKSASLRQGWRLGSEAQLRLYGKTYNRTATSRANGSSVNDQADGSQVGFRADWSRADKRLTLQGDLMQGTIDPLALARHFSGGNLLARWEQGLGAGRSVTLQAYVERDQRRHPFTFEERLDTADVVAEYAFAPAADHRVLLGAGLRHARDEVQRFAALAFIPGSRGMSWQRVYAQDQVALLPTLSATASLSLESNPYTGTEALPSLRLGWQLADGMLAWASWARAVRAPSRIDREFFQPANPPYLLAGGPDFQSEVSNVFELGLRAQGGPSLSYSIDVFRHQHSGLRSLAPTAAGPQFQNGIEGHSQGLEAWARWRVSKRWRIDAGGVLLRQSLAVQAGAVDLGGQAALGNDPRHWLSLRSAFDLLPGLSWDVSVRSVGARPLPQVPAYTALDSRLAWSPRRDFELALLLRNLGDPRHPEWGTPANRVELQRSVQLQFRWQM